MVLTWGSVSCQLCLLLSSFPFSTRNHVLFGSSRGLTDFCFSFLFCFPTLSGFFWTDLSSMDDCPIFCVPQSSQTCWCAQQCPWPETACVKRLIGIFYHLLYFVVILKTLCHPYSGDTEDVEYVKLPSCWEMEGRAAGLER